MGWTRITGARQLAGTLNDVSWIRASPVREIVTNLASRGITINPNLVYYIKGRMKRRRGQQKGRHAVRVSRNAGIANPVELVRSVKHLAGSAGGMRHLKELVDILAE